MKLQSTFAAACLLAATIVVSSGVSPASVPNTGATQDGRLELRSFDFPGGTVGEYIEHVRSVGADVNMMYFDDADALPFQPVRLRRVTASTAIGLLNNYVSTTDNAQYKIDVAQRQPSAPTETPVYVIRARAVRAFSQSSFESQVAPVSIGDLLKAGYEADAVLTAIERVMALQSREDARPPQMAFHEDTGLVLIRATPEQMNSAHGVITELRNDIERRRAQESGQHELDAARDSIMRLDTLAHEQQVRNTQLAEELAATQTRLEVLQAELEQAARRNEVLIAERDEMRGRIMELERIITTLRDKE